MRDPRTILITGASSGLGAALADAYAAPGVTLALTGRDPGRLDAVAERCRAAGAAVRGAVLDVTGRDALAAWIAEVDAATPIDLAIANAGVAAGGRDAADADADANAARRVLATNIDGVLNTVLPLVPAMRRRRRGQIALMSSLAGFRGLPGAAAYCASKAAVRVYGEALGGPLRHDGVTVSVICPGF